MQLLRSLHIGILIWSPFALVEANLQAQTNKALEEPVLSLQISAADRAAAENYSNLRIHVFPSAASAASPGRSLFRPLSAAEDALPSPGGRASISAVPAPGFYPADLTYHGGPVLKSVQSNLIFIDAPGSKWGHPGIFLKNLGMSTFIHTIDQYVGSTADNRYTVGVAAMIPYSIFDTLGNNDLLQIVHASATFFGSGYGRIFHVFLPKGVDFCSPDGSCYSPDNPSTFAFCAFHGSVDFSDVGHVIFSLEPYQNVNGCSVEQPSPNGALIDSTSNVLSHELIEAITDPDLDAWWAQSSLIEFGAEIADICENPFFKNPVSTLNGIKYGIQLEYSNTHHACANVP